MILNCLGVSRLQRLDGGVVSDLLLGCWASGLGWAAGGPRDASLYVLACRYRMMRVSVNVSSFTADCLSGRSPTPSSTVSVERALRLKLLPRTEREPSAINKHASPERER